MSLMLPPPEHRGQTQTLQLYVLIRACELLGALLFLPALPWWQPTLWFVLVAAAGSWGFWRVRQPAFKRLPKAQRRAIYRRYVWQSSVAVGSAGFLLYVPGNHNLHALLGLYMTMAAGLVAMWGVRDLQRSAVAVCLIMSPMVLRFLYDGVMGPRPMMVVLAGCGALLGVIIVYTATVQARRMEQEAVLRRQAERAADTMAELSLAKSRFFAAVSHDLRQPVHAIGLYLELLTQARMLHDDPDARRSVDGIRQSWVALDTLLSQVRRPVILHWLGEAFDPNLAGYWGSSDVDVATDTFVGLLESHADRIDGVKVSLLSAEHEIGLRARLPEGVRLYTGDDFNYPELIEGDGTHHSDALLGAFAAIAPAASAALAALDAGDVTTYRAELEPTLALSRHVFATPTFYYKTGIAFLAWLSGHQNGFTMVGGLQSARSPVHLARVFELANAGQLLPDPELAAHRLGLVLDAAGIDR